MTGTMKAVRIHQYGGAEVLKYEDAPRPKIGKGEVLVKVHAAGINPVDWKTRAGSGMSSMYQNPFPMIQGWDLSGVVEAVAPDVTRFKFGDAVFGMVRFPEIGAAYAEYCSAPEQHLALKPTNIDDIQAAAIPLAALTAWQAFFEIGNLTGGQRVLILGASGGVGHLAAQIAKWKDAYVIGTSSTTNLDFVRSLGVDEVVDYSAGRIEDKVEPVDFVLDTIGGDMLNRAYPLVKSGGSLISIAGSPDANEARKHNIKVGNFLVHTNASQLDQIADLMAGGHLQARILQVFPLAQAQQAHELGPNRTQRQGKIVLQV